MSCERGPSIQADGSGFPIPIELESFATGEVKQIPWQWEDWQGPLVARGRNIGKMYDLYFEGRAGQDDLADFEGAVLRHQQLDKMLY